MLVGDAWMATTRVEPGESGREPSLAEEAVRWLFFVIIMALVPFMATAIDDSDRHIAMSLASIFGRGDLLIVATLVSADAAGRLVSSDFPESRRIGRMILFGLCLLTIAITCLWFADISSLLPTSAPVPARTAALNSITVFCFAAFEGLAALFLAKWGPHGRD
jgi:hypothetical protein